jgi:hypothetical protein
LRLNVLIIFISLTLFSLSFYFLEKIRENNGLISSDIKVSRALGSVSIKYPGELWWRGLLGGDYIPMRSVIRTSADSLAKVIFQSGDELVIGPMSLIKIVLINNEFDVNVFSGKLSFISAKGTTASNTSKKKINFKKIEPKNEKIDLSSIYQDKEIKNEDSQIEIIEIKEDEVDKIEKSDLAILEEKLLNESIEIVKNEEVEIVIKKEPPPMKKIQLPDTQEINLQDEE